MSHHPKSSLSLEEQKEKWRNIGHSVGMDHLLISGKTKPLAGSITVGSSKNAALPIIAASLLAEEPVRLKKLPRLSDVSSMLGLLEHLNVDFLPHEDGVTIMPQKLQAHDAPYELVRKMRTSILVLGPLLARLGKARISLPGGCAIGARPIDLHLDGLKAMGAEITLSDGYVDVEVPKGRLQGAEIVFRVQSVGATQNLMMAASLAKGRTVIQGVAQEPEIKALADMLNHLGADVQGGGEDTLIIHGKEQLSGGEFSIPCDRIQAGSYALLVAATKGSADLFGMQLSSLGNCVPIFQQAGIELQEHADFVRIEASDIRNVDIVTAPFPGFPTDLQAQMMALLTQANGRSTITERIFENRFMHVPELQRMGADIQLEGDCALINATPQDKRFPLTGAEVMATDLRASFCLIMLGILAEGTTRLNRLYHLDRGYENLTENLNRLGADVQRIHA